MGLLSGIFGSGGTKTSTKTIPFDKQLPQTLQAPSLSLAKSSLGRFQQTVDQGETPEAASLFGASRKRSIREFQNAVRGSQAGFHRLGAGSSTASRTAGVDLASALLGRLALFDTQRAQNLSDRQTAGAAQGISGISALAGQGTTIPVVTQKSPGFGFSALSGFAGGAGGALGKAAGKSNFLSGLFG